MPSNEKRLKLFIAELSREFAQYRDHSESYDWNSMWVQTFFDAYANRCDNMLKLVEKEENARLKDLIGYLANRLSEGWDWEETQGYLKQVCGDDFKYWEHSSKFLKEQREQEEV